MLLLALSGCSRASPPQAPDLAPSSPPAVVGATPAPSEVSPVAVVELFTSEGCSSCPPADELLAAITDEADQRHERIFTLEFHVDYWNELGWVDPFSSSEYSARQRGYAQHFGLDGVYTPQMVVNGREQLVGSHASGARAAIARGLAVPASVSIALDARSASGVPGHIRVAYRVSARGAVELELALLQDSARKDVERGENAGRSLRHRHVVRAFATRQAGAAETGEWLAPWPVALPSASALAVAYAVDRSSHAVLGAAASPVRAARE